MTKILNPETAFSAADRQQLLAECLPAMQRRGRLVELMESADPSTRRDMKPEFDRLNEQIRNLWQTYQRGLPVVALSRCPYTGEVWSHSLDIHGIDGLWWNCYQPIRPIQEPGGGRGYAFRGAMSAPATPPAVPFLVEPGPAAPFVIERLMQMPTMVAVISHVRVGELDAYPIVYFASADLPPDARTNDWGADSFSYRGPQGEFEERQYFDAEDEFLYDLTPWVDQRRVQWIAPADDSLTLRSGADGCPYLQVPGRQAVWRCKGGRLWWGPPGRVRPAPAAP